MDPWHSSLRRKCSDHMTRTVCFECRSVWSVQLNLGSPRRLTMTVWVSYGAWVRCQNRYRYLGYTLRRDCDNFVVLLSPPSSLNSSLELFYCI